MTKAIAVLALGADAVTWLSFGKPVVALCWLLAAIGTALMVPAR